MYELLDHQKGQAYTIPVNEWDHLKARIGRIEERAIHWHTVGCHLWGAAAAALLNGFTAPFPAPPVGSKWSIAEVLNWCFFATTFLLGGLSLWFGRSHAKLQKELAQDIVKQMESIEGRFQKPRAGQEQTHPTALEDSGLRILFAKYGASGKFKDVTGLVAEKVKGGQLKVTASNENFGPDPVHGTPKQLIVEYSLAGNLDSKTAKENDLLSLP
jgi:hypothetical protein